MEFRDLDTVWSMLDSATNWRVKFNLAKLLVLYYQGGAFFSIDSTPGSSVRTMLSTDRVGLVALSGRSWHKRGTPNGPSFWDRVAYSPGTLHPFFASCIGICLSRIKLLAFKEGKKSIDEAADVDWCSGSHVLASAYAWYPHKEQIALFTPHRFVSRQ